MCLAMQTAEVTKKQVNNVTFRKELTEIEKSESCGLLVRINAHRCLLMYTGQKVKLKKEG